MKHLTFAILLIITPQVVTAQTMDLSGLGNTYELAQNRDYTDVVRGLEAVDYQIEDVTTTLLGRTRIMASNGEHLREVIVSRTTGEVLSDLVLDVAPTAEAVARQAAIDAASEPKATDTGSEIQFNGSLTVGVNNQSGSFGRGSVSARKENIGGSGITRTVTYSNGF